MPLNEISKNHQNSQIQYQNSQIQNPIMLVLDNKGQNHDSQNRNIGQMKLTIRTPSEINNALQNMNKGLLFSNSKVMNGLIPGQSLHISI